MKLNKEIKEKIDNYFNNISAEELYRVSVEEYGFIEDISFEISNQQFEKISVESINSISDESYDESNSSKFALAA